MSKDLKIIVALDCPDIESARGLVAQLDPKLCQLKIGNILFTRYGPAIVEEFQKKGYSIFLDLKFYDIPKTVAGACRSAAELGVWMINVHIQGGRKMLKAARDSLLGVAKKPLLVGVTVLTSLDDSDFEWTGQKNPVVDMVTKMAKLAQEVGLDGIVCSPKEVQALRMQMGDNFLLVTPGIRLDGNRGDQKRVTTPVKAIQSGASYLVIGHSITQALDPLSSLEKIHKDIR